MTNMGPILGLILWYQLKSGTQRHLRHHGFMGTRLETRAGHATPLEGVGTVLNQYGAGWLC